MGSISTKVAYAEDGRLVFKDVIRHPSEDLKDFATVLDQPDYRLGHVAAFMGEHGIVPRELARP